MCEHCSSESWWTGPLGNDEAICEYSDEHSNIRCLAPPTAWSYERYVEDHLCAEHTEEENVLLDEGLGNILRDSGYHRSVDYLPIGENASDLCSYWVEDDSERGHGACDKPARFATMVIERKAYCAEHLESLDIPR